MEGEGVCDPSEIIGIPFPVAMISFTVTNAEAKVPEGWVDINFLLLHFFLLIHASAKESPQERKFNDDEVGAKVCPASETFGSKILIVEYLSSIDEDLQLTPIIGILFLLAYLNMLFNSEDSPETLKINKQS